MKENHASERRAARTSENFNIRGNLSGLDRLSHSFCRQLPLDLNNSGNVMFDLSGFDAKNVATVVSTVFGLV